MFDFLHFIGFVYQYFRKQVPLGIGDFHQELAAALKHNRIAIAAPRGHAKSTFCSLYYPIYLALESPQPEDVLIVSATDSLAKHWTNKIKIELESNERLHKTYKDLEGQKWTVEELHIKRLDGKESLIQAKGSGKQIRGFRPTRIIGDDLETDEMVLSTEQRKKFDDWFWNTLMQTLKGGAGQVVVIGTILHPDSFLSELVNKGRHQWKTRIYQAIKYDGTALWPEMYSLEKLHDLKLEMGEYGFNQEYMNDPVPDESRTFKREKLKFFNQEPKGCTYFTTIDPAIEVGSQHDFTAMVTCAVDADENIYVVEVLNKKLLPKELIDAIFDIYLRWSCAVIGIEAVGYQKMLVQEVERERKRRRRYPQIVELKSEGKRKALRIEGLQPWFDSGRILIRENQQDMITQLLRFPSPRGHDDIIDALAYMPQIIRPGEKQAKKINPNSFIAEIERRRERSRSPVIWGNHNLRSIF